MSKKAAIAYAIVAVVIVVWLGWFLFGGGYSTPISGSQTPGAAGTPGGGAGAYPPTQTIVYEPAPPPTDTPVKNGSCWTNSIAAPFRTDAWRCAVGNSIEDPCFQVPGGGNDLLCGVNPAAPQSTSTFVLRLTQPLPAAQPVQGRVPSDWAWLVKLADGTLCSPFTGTMPIAAGGVSAGYGCAPKTPGGEGLLIFGDFTVNAAAGGSGDTLLATVGTLGVPTTTGGLPAIVSSTQTPVAAIWQ